VNRRSPLGALARYTVHIVLAVLVLFPLLFALVSSIRPLNEIYQYVSPVTWQTFLPTNVTFDAYITLFTERGFGVVVLNTIFVALSTVLFGVFFGALAGFAFAKFAFRGREVLFGVVLVTFMVPFEVIAIPLYQLVDDLNWIDTYFALIVPAIANGLVVFLFRQFYLDFPDSFIEAARTEGASWFRIFVSIVLPLSRPVTIGAALILFISQWESFMWPLIATRSPAFQVIQVAMSESRTQHATLWNELYAQSVIAFLIPLLFILPLQRYFVQGIASTGVKE
jgi:multiple sugar transport system permease protein